MSHVIAPALRRQEEGVRHQASGVRPNREEAPVPSASSLSAPLARMGQGFRDELGLAMARFHEHLVAAGNELLLFGLAEPHYRPRLLEFLERELELALRSVQSARSPSTVYRLPPTSRDDLRREDLLAAVDASDDLSLYAVDHPRAALRDAAGELAELRNAGDEVLLYQSEVESEVDHE